MFLKSVLKKFFGIVFSLMVAIGLSNFLWPQWWRGLFSAQGFMPHGHCYLWLPQMIRLHVGSDLLIGLSYVAISATLAFLVYKARREIPFHWMILAFGLFIIACGGTHFMEIYTLWHPRYWLSGTIKLLTAAASVTTAIALPPLVPKVFTLIGDAKLSQGRKLRLESANAELEKLNARLKELDDLKTRLFADVSHELRTPLTLVLGPVERMLAAPNLDADHRHALEVIDRNARTLLKYVNDLLDLSKLEASRMTMNTITVDVVKLLRLTVAHFDSFAFEKGIQMGIETPETALTLADPEKLQRVFLNLLSNAFKFTPEQGRIHCVIRVELGFILIEIHDSGPGIPADMREIIFERFRQADDASRARSGGTGLGLAIAKEFVELHHGKISAEDATGGGARFRIELPLVAAADGGERTVLPTPDSSVSVASPSLRESRAEAAQAQLPSAPGRDSILVVEDNADMNRFISETLAGDYCVTSAFTGREGMEKAIELRPDLILSDIMMPGMSGDQLVQEVRRHPDLYGIPLMFLTARTDDDLCVKLLKDGAQDYLRKPFAAEELRVRIRKVISTSRVRKALRKELASRSENLAELAQELIVNRRELQQAIAELRGSEARKGAIFETALDAILTIDQEGVIQEWNPAAERIFAYRKADVTGKKMDELIIPPSIRQFYHDGLSDYLVTGVGSLLGRPLELTLLRADGTEFRAELAITRNSWIDPSFYTCFIRDITERKRAEEARNQLAAIVESSDDVIISKSLDGTIVSWNAGAQRVFGYAAEEVVGQPITLLIPPERADEEPQILQRLKRGERIEHYETVRVRKDGSRIDVSLTISPIRDASGSVIGVSKIARDITERARIETQVRRLNEELEKRVAERTAQLEAINQELEAFTYSVSHDLRAPLRALQGLSKALVEDYGGRLEETGKDYCERIVGAAARMDTLIQDLLAYSRLSRTDLALKSIDLSAVLADVKHQLESDLQDKNVELNVPEELPAVLGHRAMLGQVVGNLVSNAIKFVPNERQPRVQIRAEDTGDSVRLWVEDNGIGIAPEHRERIFRIFERLHGMETYPGTGIGLALVQKGVDRLGGRVGVESVEGAGSRFWIELKKG